MNDIKEIKVWKIISKTLNRARRSCFTSRNPHSKGSKYDLHYPVNVWVKPPERTLIYAFNDFKLATSWADNYDLRYGTDKETIIIVPALARNIKERPSVAVLYSPENIEMMWRIENGEMKTPNRSYMGITSPLGTIGAEELMCIE